MGTVNFGYSHLNLIRRPYKKIYHASGSTDNTTYRYKVKPLGSFDLIPLSGGQCYNTENQVFPFEVDNNQIIYPTTKNIKDTIYLISDPDVGMMIPHIIETTKDLYYCPMYKNIDIDSILNTQTIEQFNNSVRHTFTTTSYNYKVDGFIFAQPIFFKKYIDNTPYWFVFAPRYKVNDDDIYFERFPLTQTFSAAMDSDVSVNDIVISNQNIDEMKFSQFGIGKNGISLVNGFKYTIDNAGNTKFNIGNIKSDSKAYILTDDGTNEYFELKVDSSSFNKGDVLSGSSFSALLGSVLFSLGADSLFLATRASAGGYYYLYVGNFNGDAGGFSIYVADNITNLAPDSDDEYPIEMNTGSSSYTGTFTVNGTPQNRLDKGYYNVKKVANQKYDITPNKKLQKINSLLKKISKYDILLVKK